MKTKTKKKSPISLLVTSFILLAIPLTIFLIQQTNIFRPKAADYNDRFLSYAGSFTCTACVADLNKDNVVNGGDVSKMAPCFGKRASDVDAQGISCAYADINGDGLVSEADKSCIQSQFLKTCTPLPTATLTPVPFVCTACAADLSKNGVVNGGDMSTLVPCFGKKATDLNAAGVVCAYADVNKDGNINEGDQLCIQQQFLKTCVPSPTPTPTIHPMCTACAADLNKSGLVNGGDMSALVPCFGKKATDLNSAGVSCSYADINGDGNINEGEQLCIQQQFMKTCVPSATPTPTLNPMCTACAADLNRDGVINGGDTSALSVCFGKSISERGSNGTPCVQYDIDRNGTVNDADVSCISAQMLKTCVR